MLDFGQRGFLFPRIDFGPQILFNAFSMHPIIDIDAQEFLKKKVAFVMDFADKRAAEIKKNTNKLTLNSREQLIYESGSCV